MRSLRPLLTENEKKNEKKKEQECTDFPVSLNVSYGAQKGSQ